MTDATEAAITRATGAAVAALDLCEDLLRLFAQIDPDGLRRCCDELAEKAEGALARAASTDPGASPEQAAIYREALAAKLTVLRRVVER